MGAGTSTVSTALGKENTALSSLKTSKSKGKNLRVSFTNNSPDIEKARATNNYTRLPTRSALKGSENIPVSGTKIRYGSSPKGHSGILHDAPDSLPNGRKPYRPTHIPQTCNNNNNKCDNNNVSSEFNSQNGHASRAPRASIGNLSRASTSSRYSRTRSLSPRRLEQIISQGNISRSELEHIKSAMRSCRSASASRRKSSSGSSGLYESSGRHRDQMTSFVVGSPAKFSAGAYGDMGIFKAISAVNESLYICGVMAMSEEKLRALKINCVINATLEWPPYQIPGLETMRVQVDDVPSSNLAPYFDKVADKMNEVISRGGKVLVHCMAGISRSSTLCIAYLMKHRGFPLQQAYSLMKTRRPLIRPNDGFWRQLVQYDKELRRRKGQKSSSIPKDQHAPLVPLNQHCKGGKGENPSMTVTRLSSGHVTLPVPTTKVGPQASMKGTHTRGRAPSLGYQRSGSSLPAPCGSASLARDTSNHRLGTLRNSERVVDREPLQQQRTLAFSASRPGNHWSTTYNSDYSKNFSRR